MPIEVELAERLVAGEGMAISEEAERTYRDLVVSRVRVESPLPCQRLTRLPPFPCVWGDIKVEIRLALPVADAELESIATTTLPPSLDLAQVRFSED